MGVFFFCILDVKVMVILLKGGICDDQIQHVISTLNLNISSLVSLNHFLSRLSPVLVTSYYRGKLHCNYVLVNWKNLCFRE